MPVQQTPADAQVDSFHRVAKLRSCSFSIIDSIHSEARHQAAGFEESILATQRVLKLPCRTRRLYASSQLKGIFSTLPSRGSCRLSLPAGSVTNAGTALHLSWNEIRVSRFSLAI